VAAVFAQTNLYDFQLRFARLEAHTAGSYTLLLEIDAERFDVTGDSNHALTAFAVDVSIEVIGAEHPVGGAQFNTILTLENGRNNRRVEVPFAPTAGACRSGGAFRGAERSR
jgi:hypothetical protein